MAAELLLQRHESLLDIDASCLHFFSVAGQKVVDSLHTNLDRTGRFVLVDVLEPKMSRTRNPSKPAF